MPEYKAPLRDIQFVFNELLNAEQHYAGLTGCEQVTPDLVSAIVQEGARFAEEVLSPLNQIGDQQGCTWTEAGVTTPEGFVQAYEQFVAGGWPSMGAPAEHGGQGLPGSLGAVLNEMMGAANWAWSMYPGLTEAAVRCLEHYGSPELQKTYLTKLVAGTWSGTMCLTEAHCGSDLGLLRTKAAPRADGSYAITGTKIFISSGEHDLTENIVHLVLARIEGAPQGTRGISLFVVPKFLPDAQGEKGERNGVSCGSIEHKMGIKGSATCVMNFDGATGFLVGEENRGLKHMFIMMNAARLGTAVQGLAQAELSYQGALRYARERLQMRSLSGPKNPDGPADPIIVHPDVRRMLLTQKAVIEGSRAFIYWLAQQVDIVDRGSEADASKADALLSLLTPVAKAFVTELGYECTNLGMQVYGGHGYISEWGMEQIVRDTRIALAYEGTTGIQALDLLGRKVMGSGGELLKGFAELIEELSVEHRDNPAMAEFLTPLAATSEELGDITMTLGGKAMKNPEEVGAASVDYLMYTGYLVLAYLWARMAAVSLAKADSDPFYAAKLKTARFYFQRLLPRTAAHKAAMLSGADNLMDMAEEEFAL